MQMRPTQLNCFCNGTEALIQSSGIVSSNASANATGSLNATASGANATTSANMTGSTNATQADQLSDLAIEKICRRTCSANLCNDSCLRVFASENSTNATAENDIAVLNFALTLEDLDSAFFTQGLENFTAADFTQAGFDNMTFFLLSLIRDHEIAHAAALRSSIRFDPASRILP